MKVKAYTYNGKANDKENEYLPCEVIIKSNEIVEFVSSFDVGLFPREHNSELSIIEKIYKTHNPKQRIPNGCKYYIQKSTDNGLMNIYLDINNIEYIKLKWELKDYLIQTKDFNKAFWIAVIVALLGLVSYWIKKEYIDSPIDNTTQQIINPKIVPNKAPKKEAEKDLNGDSLSNLGLIAK